MMFNYSKDQKFGIVGERWVYEQLRRRGHNPRFIKDFFNSGCDLLIDDLPVEVKSARLTLRKYRGRLYPRWQWCIKPTSHQKSEWLLVALAHVGKQIVPYLVPGSLVAARPHLQLTSPPDRYRGWLAAFREEWDMVEYLAHKLYQNGPPYQKWKRGASLTPPDKVPANFSSQVFWQGKCTTNRTHDLIGGGRS